MNDESVMLSVRLPSSMRHNFQRALKEMGTTPTEYIRGVIKEILKDRVPGPERVDYAELASSYLNGDMPSTPIFHLMGENPVPLVNKIEEAKARNPPGVIDADLLNKTLAIALNNMSKAFLDLHKKHQRLKEAVSAAQEAAESP